MNHKRKIIQCIAVVFMISSVWMPSAVNYLSNHQLRATSEYEQLIDEQKHTEMDSEEGDPFYSFTEKEIKSRISEVFSLTITSTNEVEEAKIFVPEEATIVKEILPIGVTIEKSAEENGWVLRSAEPRASFKLSLIVAKEGIYEASVGDEKITIDIEASKDDFIEEELEKDSLLKKSINDSNSTVEKEEELLNESVEDIHFSMDVGEYLEVNGTETFEVNVEVNQPIDALRIIVPKGTEFSFEDEKERILVETYADESSLWHMKVNNKSETFSVQLSLEESGQISVEDASGEVHSAFLYVNTGKASRNSIELNEANARTTVTVSTWANFRTAWNNNARTLIYVAADIPPGTSSLNTRTSSLTIEGTMYGLRIRSDGHTLSWSGAAIITIGRRATVYNFSMNGPVLNLQNGGVFHTNRASNIGEVNVNSYAPPSLNATIFTSSSLFIDTLNFTEGTIITQFDPITIRTLNLQRNTYSIRNLSGSRVVNANTVHINNGLMSWDLRNTTTTADRGWESLQATIRNNSITSSSYSTFNDQTFQLSNSSWIRGWGNFGGESVVPPEPEPNPEPEPIVYDLKLEANPNTGGTPEAETYSIGHGESTIITANPTEGYDFIRWEITSGSESSLEDSTAESTVFTMGNSNTTVQVIYEENQKNVPVTPVDPLDPEVEVDPENKPEIPEEQGLLSIDFVSQFNFGSQSISVKDQTYYARTQSLLNEDGTVNEQEERPNYVQISDRRSEAERNGWQLSVTQDNQFRTENGTELSGARMRLTNQQLATAQGGTAPSLQQTEPLELVPGYKHVLLMAQGDEGTGTWIYRFGDAVTAGNSVGLDVPKGANPEAASYSSIFTWELSMVPEN